MTILCFIDLPVRLLFQEKIIGFFTDKESDGDPLGSYQGKDLLTEEELKALADNCVAQRDFLAAQGIEFVF